MQKKYQPIPLFDTLDTLTRINSHNLNLLITQLKQSFQQSTRVLPDFFQLDYEAASRFLHSYRGSLDTFNAYRREIERLLQWAWFVRGSSVTLLKRDDFEAFLDFCKHPPQHWIGNKNVKRYRLDNAERKANPEWRPFVTAANQTYVLSQAAVQAIFRICSSFYNFLLQEELCAINPVALIRQKSKYLRKEQRQQKVIRRLSELQWKYVIETTQQLANAQPEQHQRTLFIMNCLYAMYLRISELVATPRWEPKMADFYRDNEGHWWFKTVGKGNKLRNIAVSDHMLTALKEYRAYLQLPSLPSPNENIPLISRIKGKGPVTSTRAIRSIVQTCFDLAIEKLKLDNQIEEAETLRAATVHWLRHTGISEDVKIRPREHVRDDAGHSSSAITDRYIDIELRKRHASARRKPLVPDEV
jgi:site-specific recombinase XerD